MYKTSKRTAAALDKYETKVLRVIEIPFLHRLNVHTAV